MVDSASRTDGVATLRLSDPLTSGSAPVVLTLTGLPLPLPPDLSGTQVRATLDRGPDGAPSLTMWDARGQLLLAIAARADLASATLPPGVQLAHSRRVVYTEVRRLADLCLATITHRAVRLRMGDQTTWLRPGTHTRSGSDAGAYLIALIDASEMTEGACQPDPGHLSFAVVRTLATSPRPARQIPVVGQIPVVDRAAEPH